MDEVDRYIISRLGVDGRISYEQLGGELGITGVAIKKRVKKMLDNDLIEITSDVNTSALGYYLNLILLEVDDETNMEEIIRVFDRCPRVINMYTGLGGYNLIALTLAEDRRTLESELMGSCSLRSRKGIRKSEVIQLERKLSSPFLPVRGFLAKRTEEDSPCGSCCGTCRHYLERGCLGCPTTHYYTGPM